MTTHLSHEEAAAQSDDLVELRKRAEARLGASAQVDDQSRDPTELLHELRVHQVELELQNDEMRSAHLELRRSRDLYHRLFDLAPVGYLTMDADGTIREINRAAASLLGLDPSALAGRRLSSFMTQEDADALHLHRMDVFSSGERQRCELLIRGAEQGPTPVHLDSVRVDVALSGVAVCRTVMVDLSELRRVNAALEESEQRLQRLAEHIDDVLYLAEGGQLVYVSPGWDAIWGQASSTPVDTGRLWLAAVHADDRERLVKAHSRLRLGEALDEVYRVLRPDGSIRWIRDRARPADDGQLAVGVARDVTAELEVEEELRRAHRMEAVGTLASGVAHDFNNLLMGIIGCLRQARSGELEPGDASNCLRQAEEAALRGSHLVSRLQVFGRSEPVEYEAIELDAAIQSCSRLLEVVLGRTNELEIQVGAAEALVLASQVQVDEVLLNLAANARDAMPEGGRVVIGTGVVKLDESAATARGLARSGRYYRLEFKDTGHGMDERTRRRLFEPFFTTKEVGQGTGLGLSTVFAITGRLGGVIDVRSAPGEGAAFELLFPLCDDSTATCSLSLEPLPRLSGRALLVEDVPLVRLVVRHYLEELGLEVLEADGPEQALRLAQDPRNSIDVLLSDVIMPGASGPALANQIHDCRPELKALFMSAHPRAELTRRGILGERGALIEKPFTQEGLAVALVRLLLPGDSPWSDALRVGR